MWPVDGTKQLSLESLSLLWLMMRLSSIRVPNFRTLPYAVL